VLVRVVTPPDTEPVAIDEQRDFMRVDGCYDDGVIAALLISAREMAEFYLRRSLVTRTLRAFLERFPGQGTTTPGYGRGPSFSTQHLDNFTRNLVTMRGEAKGDDDGRIHLPFPPIKQIVSVNYIDAATGNAAVVPQGDYIFDSDGSLLAPAYGKSWPTARLIPGAVWVDYVAGYGAPGDVPQSIRLWIQRKAADLNENRELVDDPRGYSLLAPYRFFQFS
jgi:hypothetical protein